MGKRVRGALAVCFAALLASAAPAGAATTHVQAGTLVVGGNPTQLAVHDATGDIYVLNGLGAATVVRFDSAGNPKPFAALDGSNVIDGVAGPEGKESADVNNRNSFLGNSIAIDNSGGLNDGALYVSTGGNREADIYLSTGKYAGRITESSDTFLPQNGGATCGIAVSPDGNVYLTHEYKGEFPRRGFIDKFRPGLLIPDSIPPQVWPVKGTLDGLDENTCRTSVDSSNAVYVTSAKAITDLKPLKRYLASVFNIADPPGTTITETANNSYVDTSNDDLYVNELSKISRYDSSGALQETFAVGEIAPFIGGVAVNPETGTAYASNLLTGQLVVYEAVTTPDVTDIAAQPHPDGAELSASLGTAGAGPIESCEVEYGTSDAYGSSVPCDPEAPAGGGQVTAEIAGLSLDTTYHYRFVVANEDGATKTPDRTFTTRAVRNLEVQQPIDVTRDSATLRATFLGAGEETSYYFEWGRDLAFGSSSEVESAGAGTGPQTITTAIEGLETNTPYYVRVIASGPAGTTTSAPLRFKTAPPDPPAVADTSASGVGPTGATLSAAVNPGFGRTVYLFEYGTDTGYGSQTTTSDSIGDDGEFHPVSAEISGLTPGTTYHFRVVAINYSGTTNGPDVTFSTPAAPRVEPGAAGAVTSTSATLNAAVAAGFRPTTYRFEYGPSPALGSSTPAAALGALDNSARPVSATVGGLQPGTTYHFRLVAANEIGETAGPSATFTTAPAPPAVAAPAPKRVQRPKKRVRCKRNQVKRRGKCVKRKQAQRKKGAKKKRKKRKKRGQRRSS